MPAGDPGQKERKENFTLRMDTESLQWERRKWVGRKMLLRKTDEAAAREIKKVTRRLEKALNEVKKTGQRSVSKRN
jgi:hypothetical protein